MPLCEPHRRRRRGPLIPSPVECGLHAPSVMNDEERGDIYRDFNERVNMGPEELDAWLETTESQSVGVSKDDDESVGHASGRRIAEIQRKKRVDLEDDDYAHMRKVIGYIARHTAQRPDKPPEELESMRWRYSLMNWGHDPLREPKT